MAFRVTSRSGERGFVAIAYAAMIVGVVGFSGLAVDVGYMQYEKRRLQAAADAAAMGALREMELGQTDLTAAGQNDAALNGFTNGQNNTTVTINNPPASGPYSSSSTAVQAIVQKRMPTFFMMVFGQNSVTISAQAVAQTSSSSGSIGACIFALDATKGNTFEISGGSTVTTACGIVVNSDSASQAFVISGGSSQLALANGAQIGVVGGSDISGGATVINSTTSASESPVQIQSFSDPLAALNPPTAAETAGVQHDAGSSALSITSSSMPASNQLNPGIYCDGISVQSTSGTLTFNPGLYVLAGGGLTINASQSTVVGTGVTFYNTKTTASQTWGCSKNNLNATKVSLNGGAGGSATFSAPTSGTLCSLTSGSLCGILFFEDRTLSNLGNAITGGSTGIFNGALYFKNSQLTFSGGSTNGSGGYLEIVADIVTISGTSNLGNDHTDLANVYTLAPHSTGGGLVQ